MESKTTAKSLPFILRLLFGALTGAFAGAASGGLAGGLCTAVVSSSLMFTSSSNGDFSFFTSFSRFVFAFPIGAYYGGLSATAVGGVIGLFDCLLWGAFVRSLNGKLVWAIVGALLGAASGAVLFGILVFNPTNVASDPGNHYIYVWKIRGVLVSLAAGIIAGPIFNLIYRPLITSFIPSTQSATAT
jgi:hypothetical protein